MKPFPLLAAALAAFLLSAAPAHAQWQTTTYTLKNGWNSIYLAGDAKYDTLDQLLPATVTQVWRWNSNPNQVQFIDSPLVPTQGTPEWSVWKRGLPAESDLSQLTGGTAYLVKCSSSTDITLNLKQALLTPNPSWVRNGANLMGFPTLKNGANYPTFASYFATFPPPSRPM